MIFKNTEFSGHIRLTLLAVVVGLGAGLASVAFKAMIQFFQSQFWRAPTIIQAVEIFLTQKEWEKLSTRPSDEVIRKGDLLIIAGLAENIKKIMRNTE